MTTPENPYITMTAKGIEDMIGKAIAPFVEDNRKLRFMLGLSLGDVDYDEGMSPQQSLTGLAFMAERNPIWKSPEVPLDLVFTAGVQHMKLHLQMAEAEVNSNGDRPSSIDIQRLEELLDSFSGQLDEWFAEFYGNEFLSKQDGNKNYFYERSGLNPHDGAQPLAWRIRDDIAWYAYHDWDLQKIRLAERE